MLSWLLSFGGFEFCLSQYLVSANAVLVFMMALLQARLCALVTRSLVSTCRLLAGWYL